MSAIFIYSIRCLKSDVNYFSTNLYQWFYQNFSKFTGIPIASTLRYLNICFKFFKKYHLLNKP
ncbi:hypothetical protein BpHYR1_003950 [Brachionus plicatilis]|uniref:Uncharacterized protein n=1 Tax=Brachionus plicatilis TaxID=10195 RepID=A0A3M7S873_BRAPC|nr:hypothetical protein BpHYR1_003950 [Brachionus plicatilis]